MSILSLSRRILGREDSKPAKKGKGKSAADSKKPSDKKPAKKVSKKKKEKVSVLAGSLDAHMVVTEKSLAQHESQTLVVYVKPEATKQDIMQSVAEKYGVEPVSVRTLQVRPKTRRRGQTAGTTRGMKKAYVTVVDISKMKDVL